MAERLALTLSDMKLREALRTQSIRDPLTGWFNRRFMEETLEREISRSARNGRPLAILMMDVDNFKGFNDAYGHEAGDVALQTLCQLIKKHIRTEDAACRYGGDEFVLIIPDTSPELAGKRAEAIRAAAGQVEIQYHGSPAGTLTLSFGVATSPVNGTTALELLRAADAALFRAKRDGRDRVQLRGQA
jgi:diguanylate cyclase (GGDEF)-like protein